MQEPFPSPPHQRKGTPWRKIALVVVVVVLVVFGIQSVIGWVVASITEMKSFGDDTAYPVALIASLVLYAILIACPFMPGIEVGVALLMLQGAAIAPFVYLATVIGLMTAYLIGRLIPLVWLHRFFCALNFQRACDLIEVIATTSPEERLAKQRAYLPKWLGTLTVDYRYVTIGVLLNVPGTFAIGGGGGILLAAGLSRLFNGWCVLLTLLIATLPVPLTVWLMGTQFGG